MDWQSKVHWEIGLKGPISVTMPNFMSIAKPLPSYDDLTVFNMVAFRHLEFLKIRHFNGR